MIYLDNNATTKLHPEVFEVIQKHLHDNWGNPNSNYSFGAKEQKVIQHSRKQVASLIGADEHEIIFTSCATESIATVFHTVYENSKVGKKHIITSQTEHSAMLSNCKIAESKGFKVDYLNVNEDGQINLEELEALITESTCLVSIMWANNETGVIHPVKKIAELCSNKNVLFHCDAVQAIGKIPVNIEDLHIDYLSISAHKFNGPKGIGALYAKTGNYIQPLILGGSQEGGLRGGTYNSSFIAGMGKAAEIARINLSEYQKNTSEIRNYFEKLVSEKIPEIYFNGNKSLRLPNTSNFGILGIDSEIILNYLDNKNIFISTGSACSSNSIAPSHVISAMKDYNRANEAIRLSLSASTTTEEIEVLSSNLVEARNLFL